MRESFIAIKEPIFGIHGGGCIGLGLMADIVSKAYGKKMYHIVATSNDEFFNVLINANHQLHLQHGNDKKPTLIKNITMIGRNSANIIDLYTHASFLAICLTPIAFNESAENIAKGIINRYQSKTSKLNILILMNLQNSNHYVKKTIATIVERIVTDSRKSQAILETVNFIATVPDRVVTKIDADEIRLQLSALYASKMKTDTVSTKMLEDKASHLFKDATNPANAIEISQFIRQYQIPCVLFRAEKEFRLYIPRHFSKELNDLSNINFVDDIGLLETIKNKFINGPHTILAWLGGILGCKTIAESIRYPGMKTYIQRLMDNEISPILKKTYPKLIDNELANLKNLFFKRCEMSNDDPVSRVGRNPLTKLDRFGRVLGTISLRNGCFTSLPCLEMGVAAGVVYALKNQNLLDQGCNTVKELFKSHHRSYTAILCHKNKNEHVGLDPIKDQNLIIRIVRNIQLLKANPARFMEMQPLIRSINFFSDPLIIKKKIMLSFFNKIGININLNKGQLSYQRNFEPMHLNFELVFIRHGETYGNAGFSTQNGEIDLNAVKLGNRCHEKRIFQGNVDEPINQLTDLGKQQAVAAANQLFDQHWIPDIIFHSPLKRAKDTGLPFVELLKKNNISCEYRECPNIRELSFGAWENRRVCDMPIKHPCHQFYQMQNALIKEDGDNIHGNFCEAESFYQVLLRAYETLNQFNEQYHGKKILMYSHSMFGAACCILMGKGKVIENGHYLAFDGKKRDGSSYTMPNATPFFLNVMEKSYLVHPNL